MIKETAMTRTVFVAIDLWSANLRLTFRVEASGGSSRIFTA